MKYINTNKLIAEIKKLEDQNNKLLQQHSSIGREFLFGISGAYSEVLKIIKSLQQEQLNVDLKKALNDLDNAYFDLDGIAVVGATHYLTVNDLKDIARYFYELGLKAGKS